MDPNQQPNQQPERPQQPEQNQWQQPQQQQPPQQTPSPVQPSPTPQQFSQPNVQNIAQENPGKLFGILSIVMIFVFPLLGIIFGAISRSKSKAASMPAGLGTAGLIINIIVFILSIIGGILFFIFIVAVGSAASTSDSSSSFPDSSSSSDDSSIVSDNSDLDTIAARGEKYAEAYNIEAGDYPLNTADFSKYPSSTLPAEVKERLFSSLTLTSTSVTYIYCGVGSAQLVYLGDSQDDERITALGTASTTEVCPKQL